MPHRQESTTSGRGALFEIIVSVDAAEAQRMRSNGQAIPQVFLRALIDSGADCTFIDTSHLPFVSRQISTMQIVGGPSGSLAFAPQYEVSLVLPHQSGVRRAHLTREYSGLSTCLWRRSWVMRQLLAAISWMSACFGTTVQTSHASWLGES